VFQLLDDLLLGAPLAGARLPQLGIQAFLVLPGEGRESKSERAPRR